MAEFKAPSDDLEHELRRHRKSVEPKEDEDLKEIVQEQLDNIEEIVKNSDKKEELKKKYSEFKKMETPKQDIDNRELYNQTARVETSLLKNRHATQDVKESIHTYAINILKETHFIKKSQAANNKTTYLLMFAAGTIFGMGYEKWMPFLYWIWELTKLTK